MIICGQKLAIPALVLSIDVSETALEFSVWQAAIFQDSIYDQIIGSTLL